MNINKITGMLAMTSAMALLSSCSNEPGVIEYSIDKPSSMWSDSFASYRNDTSKVEPIADLRIYQIMVESFQDGDPDRNYNVGYGPSSHKGDLRGVINAIPYIKSLNMNAIWLTPIFESAREDEEPSMLDATGYYTRDYYKIDRRFGDEETLKELVDTAHRHGLYVILDGVFGHFREDLNNTSPTGKKLTISKKCMSASRVTYDPLEKTACTDFNDHGESLAYIKEVGSYYIENYKIDGWRLDQAYQIPLNDLREFRQSIEQTSLKVTYTDSQGRKVHPLGYVVGEFWTDNPTMKYLGYGPNENPALRSNFDFGLRYALVQALATEEWGKRSNSAFRIVEGLSYDATSLPGHAYPNLMITNHDLLRFADLVQRAGYDESLDSRVKLALSYLAVVHSGPITSYYGEELGQEVPNYAQRVETMGFKDDHVSRDNGRISGFTEQENERKELFSFLMGLRKEHGAISNGRMEILMVRHDMLAVRKRFNGDDSFIYLMNLNRKDTQIVSISKELLGSGKPKELIYSDCKDMAKDQNGNYVTYLKPLSFQVIQSDGANKCFMP